MVPAGNINSNNTNNKSTKQKKSQKNKSKKQKSTSSSSSNPEKYYPYTANTNTSAPSSTATKPKSSSLASTAILSRPSSIMEQAGDAATDLEASFSTIDEGRPPSRKGNNNNNTTDSRPRRRYACVVIVLVMAFLALILLAWMQWNNTRKNDSSSSSSSTPSLTVSAATSSLLHALAARVVQEIVALQQLDELVQDLVSLQEESTTRPFWCPTGTNMNVCNTWPFVTVPFWDDFVRDEFVTKGGQLVLLPRVIPALQSVWQTYIAQEEEWWVTQADVSHHQESWWTDRWTEWGVAVPDDFSAAHGVARSIFQLSTNATALQSATDTVTYPHWQTAPWSSDVQAWINHHDDTTETSSQVTLQSRTAFDSVASLDVSTQLVYPLVANNNNGVVVAQMAWQTSWKDRLQSAISDMGATHLVLQVSSESDDEETSMHFAVNGQGQVESLAEPPSSLQSQIDNNSNTTTLLAWGNLVQDLLEALPEEYTGPAVKVDGFNEYTIRVFPQAVENDDDDSSSILALCLGILACGLLILVAAYTYMSYRQQRALEKSAFQADAVVSSLFPHQVKEQLYEQHGQELTEGGARRRNSNEFMSHRRNSNEMTARRRFSNEASTSTRALSPTSFMNPRRRNSVEHSTNGAEAEEPSSSSNYGDFAAPPIAEYYDTSTILFSDLAGFTKWSAGREPAEVFEFLERLYGGFDEAAQMHGIFKIEVSGGTRYHRVKRHKTTFADTCIALM